MDNIERKTDYLNNNTENGESEEFTTSMIPLFLYAEFSEKLGIEEEKMIHVNNFMDDHEYHVRKLNPLKEFAGFEGAIGIRKDSNECTYFDLWTSVPLGTEEHTDPDAILQIIGGPRESGSWCDGWGQEMKYEIIGKLANFSGMSLKNQPLVNLIADIFKRASELANDPRCTKPSYYRNRAPVLRP